MIPHFWVKEKQWVNKMHICMHGFFNGIAQKYFDKYKTVSNKYNDLTCNNQPWDFLSHSDEENDSYYVLYVRKQEYAIISVVFTVMAIEGLINEYGLICLGKDEFDRLDKILSLQDKIVGFYSAVTERPFPKDKQLYQDIGDLISVRNNLVHSKSIEVDLSILSGSDEEFEKAYFGYANSLIGNCKSKFSKKKIIYEVIENAQIVYDELKRFLHDSAPDVFLGV